MFGFLKHNFFMNREDCCPKCGSEGFVQHYISVLLSFERADLAVVACVVVFLNGVGLGFSLGTILLFAALAVLPVLVQVRRKQFCERCEIDFISELKKQPRS